MKNLQFKSYVLGSVERFPTDFTLPDFPRKADGKFDRNATVKTLLDEEYGYIDDTGVEMQVTDVTDDYNDRCNGYGLSGKAKHKSLEFKFIKGEDSTSFVLDYFEPLKVAKTAFILQINFRNILPNKYCPLEELIDNGVSLAHVHYTAITSDNADFTNGLARLIVDRSKPKCAGKIAVWAWALIKIAHYLIDNGYTTKDNLYVAGHSRLGKTALLTCALDECFTGCLSNCSGCCGAAISKNKIGESLKDINDVLGYWFTDTFKKYNEKENELPFDQHYLIAAIAPRVTCIVAAEEDTWSDTEAQYLCAEAATPAYEELGVEGLHDEGKLLEVDQMSVKGQIKFSRRSGAHFFNRDDWHFLLKCITK